MVTHTIELDEYEISNLRAVIIAAGYGATDEVPGKNPLRAIHNGDWLGQIFQKLPQVTWCPNESPLQLARKSIAIKAEITDELLS